MNPEIKILFADVDAGHSVRMWDRYFYSLPDAMRREIGSFRRWQDRQVRLFGKLLLLQGLKEIGYDPDALSAVTRDEFGRPRLNNTIDFNLTHSGSYVACALTADGKVGIDIEEVVPINIGDFNFCLTTAEFRGICNSAQPIEKFYEYWTQKESILKADGRGLSIPMSEVALLKDKALLFRSVWFYKRIDIAPGYICHLAANIENTEVNVRRVKFRQ